MMPCLKDLGVASIPWSPLGGGVLCRPISTQKEDLTTRGEWIAANISEAEIKASGPPLKAWVDTHSDRNRLPGRLRKSQRRWAFPWLKWLSPGTCSLEQRSCI